MSYKIKLLIVFIVLGIALGFNSVYATENVGKDVEKTSDKVTETVAQIQIENKSTTDIKSGSTKSDVKKDETTVENTPKLNATTTNANSTSATVKTTGTSNDEPKVNDLDAGRYEIQTMDNKSVEVKDNSNNNEANVEVGANNNDRSESINLKKVNNDYYAIQFEHSGKYADVKWGQAGNGQNVWQYDYNGSDAQLWKVLDYTDYYKVMSKLGNYYLTVSNNNVVIDSRDLGNAQNFRFIRDEKIKPGKTIEDGLYQIALISDQSKVATTAGNDNEANVNLGTDTNAKEQRVNITYTNDGYYVIKFESSGKAADVKWNYSTDNTNVWQYDYNGTDAQKWSIQKVDNEKYKIVSKTSNSYLTNVNQNLVINKNNLGNNQVFNLIRINNKSQGKVIENGLYQISLGANVNSVVTINGGNNEAIANIQTDTNARTQRVNITYGNDGYYVIKFESSGKSLDVKWAQTQNGNKVWQYDYNGSDAQKWIIEKTSDGKYKIKSKVSASYITNSNSNLVVNKNNLGNNQVFNLIRVENKSKGKVIDSGLYQIVINANSVVAVSGDNNEAAVKIQNNNNDKKQRVSITYTNDGYYVIKFENSGKALDVKWAESKNGTQVWQYDYNGSDAQKWIIEKVKDNQYRIISKQGGSYLTNSNNNIVINKNNQSQIQTFNFILINPVSAGRVISDGLYEIELGTNSALAMDVINADVNNGAMIQGWIKNNNNAQKVKITYTNDGYYILRFQNSGRYLDVKWGQTYNGNKVWQYDYNGSDAQKWIIEKVDGDYYRIKSKASNTYLTINSTFEINKATNNAYQLFKFNKREMIGIDVSEHNHTINWDYVKANVDFAIIRVGYGENDSSQDDGQFARNVAECKRLGIPYGVYIYSYALDEAHARSEAEHTLRMLGGKCGTKYNPTLGVWFDMEDADNYKARKGMPSNDQLVTFCDIYCDTMIKNGYKTGIYASLSWLNNQLNSPKLDKYDKWVAQWYDRCTYEKKYVMWQYTSDGSVPGIEGRVDMNKYYM